MRPLHFKPADHVLGDVHPFFREGECFLYYLKPGEFRSSLLRSRDLLHWREADVTHSPVKPDDWMGVLVRSRRLQGSYGTGISQLLRGAFAWYIYRKGALVRV